MEYKILYKDGRAKRAEMKTVHGTIQTPVFMNVGTVAAIKGAVSTDDLRTIGTQGDCGRLKKRAFILTPTSMVTRFSWDRRKVCRFSPT